MKPPTKLAAIWSAEIAMLIWFRVFASGSYAVDAGGYREFLSPAGGRDLAAYLCRRYNGATLRELSIEFELLLPDGSANWVR